MSRLWPESIKVGLFPGHCQLKLGRTSKSRECSAEAGHSKVLGELDVLLAESGPFNRFSRAEVFVSDSYGRSVLIPWQQSLDSQAQVLAYGRACLHSSGSVADDGWASHAGFREFDSSGLCSALPVSFVEELRETLARHGLGLRSVLPITAAAYWHHQARRNAGRSVLLLEEPDRLTAIAYEKRLVRQIDVEPVLKRPGAITRLAHRVRLTQGTFSRVDLWCATVSRVDHDSLEALFEGAVIEPLMRAHWGVT